MDQLFQRPLHSLSILLLYLAFISLISLGNWGVIESSEARYAEISREMLQSGDWMHPTLLGIKHYHKPPITYWITAFGYKLFGVNPFGARFFLVISFLSQVILIYSIARKLFANHYDGLVTAVIYSCFPIVLVSVRGLTTDSYLMTFVLAAIASWLHWKSTNQPFWLYVIALMLGLGFLTKGPVALIIPVLVMLGLKPFKAEARSYFTIHYILSFLFFLLVALSWFVALVIEDWYFFDYFLFRHTIERYAYAEVFKRVEPWWYYLVFAPLLALPWVMVFIFRIRETVNKSEYRIVKQILLFWIAIPFIFFSISSSKLVLYVLPLYAGVALAAGFWVNKLSQQQAGMVEKIVLAFTGLMGVSLAVYFNLEEQVQLPWIMRLSPILFLIGLIIIRQVLRLSVQSKPLIYSLYLTGFLVVSSSILIRYNDLKFSSSQSLADWIKLRGFDNRPILVYNRMLPSLSFHLQKPIISLNDGSHNLNREIQFEKNEEWKNELFFLKDSVDTQRLAERLQEPSLLIVKNKIKDSSAWLYEYYNRKQVLGAWTIFFNEPEQTVIKSQSEPEVTSETK
jgi:4-amino-4-deoxy-L-arabinose transferase